MFDILLNDWVVEFSSDKSLGVEDSVEWVFGSLVVSCVTDKSLGIGESDVGWSGSVTLVIGDDLDSFVFPESDT